MDKGFYSEINIDTFYANHIRFRFYSNTKIYYWRSFTISFAYDAVEEFCGTIRSQHNSCIVFGDGLYAVTKPMTWNGHQFYVYVYYDSFKVAMDEKKFDHTLYYCMKEILNGKRVREQVSCYEKPFFIKESPIRSIKAEYNKEAIAEYKCNRIGWFVLATDDIRDKILMESGRNFVTERMSYAFFVT